MDEQIQSAWGKLLDKLASWLDTIIVSLPNFLIASVTFILAYWLSKNLQGYLNKFLKRIIKQPSIRGLITNLVSIVVVVLGVFLALAILNLDGTLKSLLAGAGVAGLAISLALQGALSNTFSGVFIAVKDELNVGDYVESNGYAGEIYEIDLRNTKIRESDNNIVVIPNKLILENPFKNYGLTKKIRTTIECGVGYESDLEMVEQTARDAIKKIFPDQESDNIEFYYTNFGESSIDFILRFWLTGKDNVSAVDVKSKAIIAIKKTFEKNEISIPYPIRTISGNLNS